MDRLTLHFIDLVGSIQKPDNRPRKPLDNENNLVPPKALPALGYLSTLLWHYFPVEMRAYLSFQSKKNHKQ
jgi:hypothetical protein